MTRWSGWSICTALLLLSACDDDKAAAVAPSVDAGVPDAAAPGDRLAELTKAELTRQADAIRDDDLNNRDVAVRRAAVRALARIRGDAARPLLLRALADEDAMVVSWAAYGLGDDCARHRDANVSALVAAAVGHRQASVEARGKISPEVATARAIGRCNGKKSEALLRDWARGGDDRALAAIRALGDIATERQKLEEDTLVALLNLAAGDAVTPPMGEALYPFGRLKHLPPKVHERTFEVANARLADDGSRLFAVRALARSGDIALDALVQLVATGKGTPSERAEAVRSLSRFGRDGQNAAHTLLAKLAPAKVAALPAGAEFGVLLVLLETITSIGDARPTLLALANLKTTELPATEKPPTATLRRLALLRCRASLLLAERDYTNALLSKCDPLASSIGARTMVSAIGIEGVKIVGKRREAWSKLAREAEPRARAQAIALIGEHPELDNVRGELSLALQSELTGVVAAAAEMIAKHPQLAFAAKEKVDATIRDALIAQLEMRADFDLEAIAAVIDASERLVLDGARKQLQAWCDSPYATGREHAARALSAILGGKKVTCAATSALALPAEADRLRTEPLHLVVDSDVGELKLALDATLAPLAVTRVADLVKDGFYDGMTVHRVVPGFVTQFGSPTSDGFGTPKGRPSIPCETSPVHYGPWHVGVALAGRDTGTSQLFVTHTPTPHLDGRYALIGSATGPWDALVDGDQLISVKIQQP